MQSQRARERDTLITQREHLSVRPYRSGDAEALDALCQRVHGKEVCAALWRWRAEAARPGKVLRALAWDEGLLVGHLALLPRRVAVSGEAVSGGLWCDELVHPEYAGEPILEACARAIRSQALEAGIRVALGFTSGPAARRPTVMGRRQVGRFPLMVRVVNVAECLRAKVEASVLGSMLALPFRLKDWLHPRPIAEGTSFEPLLALPDGLAALLAEAHRHVDCGTIRDMAALHLRYVVHPEAPYLHTVLRDGPGVRGLLIARLVERMGMRMLFLMDCIHDPLDPAAGRELLSRFCSVALAGALSFPMQPGHDLLREQGFIPVPDQLQPWPVRFELQAFERPFEEPWLFDARNWTLSFGDTLVV